MKATVNFETSDYMKIAALVSDAASDESSTYEVEYKVGNYLLILTVSHEVEYSTEIGGSYEGYDFERVSVLDREVFGIDNYECHTEDGEEVASDFDSRQLENILN